MKKSISVKKGDGMKKLLCAILFGFYCLLSAHHGTFEEIQSFLQQMTGITKNSLVFDVGAHKGSKAIIYVLCGARVVCFEPQPECVTALHNRFDDYKQVAIEAVGIADKEGELEFLQCKPSTSLSTFSKEWAQEGRFAQLGFRWKNRFMVPVTTLDNMITKYGVPQFCKIDVENFEYKVLAGLSQSINALSFEIHSEALDKCLRCLERLQKLGYKRFNFVFGEWTKSLCADWVSAEQLFTELQKAVEQNYGGEKCGMWGDVYARAD